MERSNKGQDRVAKMSEPSKNDERNERCAELSGDENQGEELISAKNEECDNEECQPGPSKNHKENDEANDSDDQSEATLNSSKSSVNILAATQCSESIPSSGSNKENIDGNVLSQTVEFHSGDSFDSDLGNYDNADQIPLPQLLKLHIKHLISGFEFGEATKRRAQENMKTARDKNRNERKNEETGSSEEDKESIDKIYAAQPCSSKLVTETEHKTPHSRKRQRLGETKNNLVNSDKDNFCEVSRRVPECIVKYTDCKEVWMYMIFKEEAALKLRNPRIFIDFKGVTPRMRAILLDWLMEVASVYHLRRVTYYLSVDYFDRFLSIRPDIPKSLLQLVGITCLYIAAKVEEIYPPNLAEFSYVCDGACKAKEMVSCELLILNSLGWEVILTTPTDWLNLYMQLHSKSQDVLRCSLNLDFNRDFIFPTYSAYQFTRASQLMDLMSLDPGFLKFGYSVVAAAAMYYMYGQEVALAVSGLTAQQLGPCVDYMEVFHTIIKDSPDPRLQSCLGGPHPEDLNRMSNSLKRMLSGPKNENYSFQTHIASMEYFEKATIYRLSRFARHQEDVLLEMMSKDKPELANENEETTEGQSEDNYKSSLIDHLTSLVEEAKTLNEEKRVPDEDLTLDEIFELILDQDETKSTNNE